MRISRKDAKHAKKNFSEALRRLARIHVRSDFLVCFAFFAPSREIFPQPLLYGPKERPCSERVTRLA
jgi:hypothetical protein